MAADQDLKHKKIHGVKSVPFLWGHDWNACAKTISQSFHCLICLHHLNAIFFFFLFCQSGSDVNARLIANRDSFYAKQDSADFNKAVCNTLDCSINVLYDTADIGGAVRHREGFVWFFTIIARVGPRDYLFNEWY